MQASWKSRVSSIEAETPPLNPLQRSLVTDIPPTEYRLLDRNGVRHLTWSEPPIAGEGMIDKAKVTIKGTFEFAHRAHVATWCDSLAGNLGLESLFSRTPDDRGRGAVLRPGYYRLGVLPGLWTLSGGLELRHTELTGGLKLDLNLNPTRTLKHLLSRYEPEELPDLAGYDFFRRNPNIDDDDPSLSLDQNDNMLSGRRIPRHLPDRVEFFEGYLRTYEIALQRLLIDVFAHTQTDAPPTIEGADIVMTGRGHFADAELGMPPAEGPWRVRLHWGQSTLGQCECYWERGVPHAVPWVRRFADRVLGAARDVRVRRYDLRGDVALAREAGALTVTTDLGAQRRDPQSKATKQLVVYAKDPSRVRFEVRILSDPPRRISQEASRDLSRLSSLLLAARRDAVARLPWAGMGHLMEADEGASPADVVALAEEVRSAMEEVPRGFRPALEALLFTGGITSTGERGAAPVRALDRLRRRGVIEEVPLVSLPRRGVGRRFRLTGRFVHLPAIFGATLQPHRVG